jgi:hypothetical protein
MEIFVSLRTTGLIAGVIGVILLIVGFVANSVRPPDDVVAHADVQTSVVIYQSDFMTISPQGTISAFSDGDMVAYTARPVDADAWLADVAYTEVTSLPDWEVLGTTDVAKVEPSESPSPSGSPDPSASASESATPSASPSPSDSPSPSPSASPSESGSASPSPSASASPEPMESFASTDGRSTDLWRDEYTGSERIDIPVDSVPTGLTLVIMTVDGSPLSGTDLSLTREINDDWIAPLLWWGAILVVAGIAALIVLFIDLRPAQSKGESWVASRKSLGRGDAEPGSRRSRRAAGAVIPEASLEDKPRELEVGTSAESSPASDADAATAPGAQIDDGSGDGSDGGPKDTSRDEGTEDRS